MPSLDTLVLFAAAAAALIALPGPAMLLIIGRGVSGGRRVAVATALGVEAATALMVLATAAGLSALIASSAVALQVVRWAGIAYLLLLAVRALISSRRPGLRLRAHGADGDGGSAGSAARAFRTGLAVGLSNPKVVLFFLAFFPQFVDPAAGAAWTQVLVLGAVFVALGLAGDLTYALLAGGVGRWLRRHPGFAARTHLVEAGTFAGMAAVLGLTGEARGAVRGG